MHNLQHNNFISIHRLSVRDELETNPCYLTSVRLAVVKNSSFANENVISLSFLELLHRTVPTVRYSATLTRRPPLSEPHPTSTMSRLSSEAYGFAHVFTFNVRRFGMLSSNTPNTCEKRLIEPGPTCGHLQRASSCVRSFGSSTRGKAELSRFCLYHLPCGTRLYWCPRPMQGNL